MQRTTCQSTHPEGLISTHPAFITFISGAKAYKDGTFATQARIEVTFKFNGNKVIARTATEMTTFHDHDEIPDADPNDKHAGVHTSIEA